jgi:hypothetical protein
MYKDMDKNKYEELSPLVGEAAVAREEDNNTSVSKARIFGSVAALVSIAGLMNVFSSSGSSTNNKSNTKLQLSSQEMSFVIKNEYGSDIPGDGYYPWKLIAEPYKISTFMAVEPAGLTMDEGTEVSYHWHILENDAHHFAWGSSMEYSFQGTGKKSVNVARYVTNLETQEKTQTHHTSEDVQVKYVKREMRSLTDGDRDAFFGALEAVYKTSDVDGIAKYGSNFVSMDNLVKSHLMGAGKPECDHWHDGAGIMVHHLSFTLKLELALQAINPAVTVPYWEYTIDSVE